MSQWRFVSVVLLLLATGTFLHRRGQYEFVPARTSFASFPSQLGEWMGRDIIIPGDVRRVLGAGDFLLRDYKAPEQPLAVNLFLAYIPSQRTGDTIHSPENCLPGAGWSPVESRKIEIAVPGQGPFTANRYVVSKGMDREMVVYWYWAHGRAESNEYLAKLYLVADAFRLNRSDGSLVRLITPLRRTDTDSIAERRILDLARDVVPILGRYVPE